MSDHILRGSGLGDICAEQLQLPVHARCAPQRILLREPSNEGAGLRGDCRFLHHTPTEAMKAQTLAQDGIKRAWRLACARERLNPNDPGKLPLIFGIDALLDIPDGFVYVPNCREPSSPGYGSGCCAGHIGCAAGCAGDSAAADG